MKPRDSVLFGLPFAAVLVVLVVAGFFYRQFVNFERSFQQDAKNNIAEESRLVEYALIPLLDSGREDAAVEFCKKFGSAKTRLSLIDLGGRVLADSMAENNVLSNHLNRPEVQTAMSGTAGDAMRYSSSLDRWMMYRAVKLKTARGDYILRVAISTDGVSKSIGSTRLMMLLALLFGGLMMLPFFLYIYNKIRKPLLALVKSSEAIAAGELDTRITIPKDGVVREIAIAASRMAEQLKHLLNRANRAKEETEAILNAMTEAVFMIEENGRVSHYNPAGASLFKLNAAAEFNIARCGIPELPGLVRQAFSANASFEKELSHFREGVAVTLLVKGQVLAEGQLLLTVTDLTNLRKLESFRSDFIANVSHEIKTPLTCIIGAAEMLEDEALEPAAKQRMLSILSTQSKRLNALVQDILSLAALERKQALTTREFSPLALDTMLLSAANQCRERADAANVALAMTRSEPLSIDGDCQLLEQAVVNIIGNALNYSGTSKIDLSLYRENGDAVIEVRDYGIGIAPEHQARIFERFYRVHKERSRERGGTGLGLAIVKHIAQLHHGRAELESAVGSGCRFRLVLPLQN